MYNNKSRHGICPPPKKGLSHEERRYKDGGKKEKKEKKILKSRGREKKNELKTKESNRAVVAEWVSMTINC